MKKIIFLFLIIMSMMQSNSSILKTGIKMSYTNGDDGYYQSGMDRSYSRDDINEIVTDNVTGLMWQDDIQVEILKTNDEAINHCENLTLGGYDDWRLPQITELSTLIDLSNSTNHSSKGISRPTTFQHFGNSIGLSITDDDNDKPFIVHFLSIPSIFTSSSQSYETRCVRGNIYNYNKKFSIYENFIVDTEAKLMWQKANLNTMEMTWYEGLEYCENLTLANFNDWRMPNLFEFLSIVTESSGSNSEIITSNVFDYLKHSTYSDYSRYWTSTSSELEGLVYESLGYSEEYKDLAYYIDYPKLRTKMSGNIDFNAKAKGKHYVVCIRTYNDGDDIENFTTSNTSPTLTISFDKTSINTNEIISFTSNASDSDGEIVSYSWDFGDGGISSEANPTHTYSTVGTYNVTCIVTDDSGASENQNISITVNEIENIPPTLTISSDKNLVKTKERINFLLTANDSDGNIVSYHWDFGDGHSASYRNPYNSYETAGEYNVTCSVKDDKGAITTKTILITVTERENLIPYLNISILKTSENAKVYVNETANFRATAVDTDGEIISYSWDFGDGSTSSEANPTHTYSTAGTYNVTCIVTDDSGAIKSQSLKIEIEEKTLNSSPTLTINASKLNIKIKENFDYPHYLIDEKISFTSNASDSDGEIVSYKWDFGDGDISNEANPTHTFYHIQTYDVTCMVTDNNGAITTKTLTINITRNSKPIATFSSFNVNTYQTYKGKLTATDSDDDNLTYSIVEYPYSGILTLLDNNGSFTYAPEEGYTGTLFFEYIVSDGIEDTFSKLVEIRVVNTHPILSFDEKNMNIGETLSFTKADFSTYFKDDYGSELMKIKIIKLPTNGILKLNGDIVNLNQEILSDNLNNLTFTPYSTLKKGSATRFSVMGYDGTDWSNEAIMVINIIDTDIDFVRDNSLEVVIDMVNNLMWQDDTSVKITLKSWVDAIDYCENLNFAGFNDWSLPNIKEYLTIIDNTRSAPALRNNFKNYEYETGYWTSTSFYENKKGRQIYYVNLKYGNIASASKDNTTAHIRCLRVIK